MLCLLKVFPLQGHGESVGAYPNCKRQQGHIWASGSLKGTSEGLWWCLGTSLATSTPAHLFTFCLLPGIEPRPPTSQPGPLQTELPQPDAQPELKAKATSWAFTKTSKKRDRSNMGRELNVTAFSLPTCLKFLRKKKNKKTRMVVD